MILTECPRDAWQGLHDFVPTTLKAEYINLLLEIGFDVIDFGSFVSPKAMPQMADTAELVKLLNLQNSRSKLLSIVANLKGAEQALAFEEISILGFPFSISETFQKRNTNSTIDESLIRVDEILNLSAKKGKELLIYISMGFGNPYNDEWNTDIIYKWVNTLNKMGIKSIMFADTIGVSNPENIHYVFENIVPEFNGVSFGAHLHTTPETWKEKIEAAIEAKCDRFDVAIKGFGGCPMAQDDLVGNMPTENLLNYISEKAISTNIDFEKFKIAYEFSSKVFI
jgi:hydroxymethylglutaryl-CoA lyase